MPPHELIALVRDVPGFDAPHYEETKFFEDSLASVSLSEGAVDEVVPELLGLLADSRQVIRTRAWFALAHLHRTQQAEPTLRALAVDPRDDVAAGAVVRLREVAASASTREVVRALVLSARSTVAEAAVLTYCQLMQGGGDATLAVLSLLDSADWQKRLAAVNALGTAGPPSRMLMRVLMECLRDPDDSVRLRAADALGGYVDYAGEVVPALEPLLRDPHMHVRSAAEAAVGALRANMKATDGDEA